MKVIIKYNNKFYKFAIEIKYSKMSSKNKSYIRYINY